LKTKKKQGKVKEKQKFSAEKILKKANDSVLKYVEDIKNNKEKEDVLRELISYLENCLLDRDAGKPGPKLIDKLKIKMNEIPQDGDIKTKSAGEKVWWKGTEPQIIYFFELLFNVNLIDKIQYDNRFALIENNFKNKFGNALSNDQLARSNQNMLNSKSNGKPKKKDADEIEDVLKEIREILKIQNS